MAKHIYKPITTAASEYHVSELDIIYMNQCLSLPEIVIYENHLYADMIGLSFIINQEGPVHYSFDFFDDSITDKLEFDDSDFFDDYNVITDIHADEKKRGYDYFSSDPDDYPDRDLLNYWKSL